MLIGLLITQPADAPGRPLVTSGWGTLKVRSSPAGGGEEEEEEEDEEEERSGRRRDRRDSQIRLRFICRDLSIRVTKGFTHRCHQLRPKLIHMIKFESYGPFKKPCHRDGQTLTDQHLCLTSTLKV